MKKSSFTALVLGTVSGLLFALGMCMALVEEWNSLKLGIALGGIGIALGIITVFVWRKMEHKAPVRLSGKSALRMAVGIAGALLLGIGMSLCIVFENIIAGSLIGVAGIILLLCLIPLIKGIKD